MNNSSTTLKKNTVLTNKVEANITSGNIVPGISDHDQLDVDNASVSSFQSITHCRDLPRNKLL